MNSLRSRTIATLISVTALAGCGGDNTPTTPSNASTNEGLGRPIGRDRPPAARNVVDRDARVAARAFLTSYLNISYGRAKSASLRNATQSLRERLRANAPRVPPGVQQRRPRVVALQLESVAAGQIRATATVDDDDIAPYPLFATLERQADDRWIATTVGG